VKAGVLKQRGDGIAVASGESRATWQGAKRFSPEAIPTPIFLSAWKCTTFTSPYQGKMLLKYYMYLILKIARYL